ncbi:MAG: hypothetical protein WAW03_00685 [Anaerolineae bacterium]|uniref:hypothetical protein n=1 Tax=Candidatus Amarolinea dominans TaxID=3140696 RepID=UPI0031355B0E|nr:hypothetical protein [Anaerolineae bacterium]MBK9233781.1 hypothetical protein [Anaerolineae bacterium]
MVTENYLLESQAVQALAVGELREFVRSQMDLSGMMLFICKRIGQQPVLQRVLRANDKLTLVDRGRLQMQLRNDDERIIGYLVNLEEARPFEAKANFRLGDRVSELNATIKLYFHILDPEKIVRNINQDPLKRLCEEICAELQKLFSTLLRYQDIDTNLAKGEAMATALGDRHHLGLGVEKVSVDFELPETVRKSLEEIVAIQIKRDLEGQKQRDLQDNLEQLERQKSQDIRKEEIAVEIAQATLDAGRKKLQSQIEREAMEAEAEKARESRRMEAETRRKEHELRLLAMQMEHMDPHNPASLLVQDAEFRRSYLQMVHTQEMEKIRRMADVQVQQMDQDKQIELRYAEARLQLIQEYLKKKGDILEQDELERLVEMLDKGRPDPGAGSRRLLEAPVASQPRPRPAAVVKEEHMQGEEVLEGKWAVAEAPAE